MKRPLFFFVISFCAGILWTSFFDSYLFLLLSSLLWLVVGLVLHRRLRTMRSMVLVIVTFFLLGGSEYIYFQHQNTKAFKHFQGQTVVLEGYIESIADIREAKVSYVVMIKNITQSGQATNIKGKVRLTTLKKDEGKIYSYGTQISVVGTLELPSGRRNPGGFDYQRYLAKQGISGTMFAKEEQIQVGETRHRNPLIEAGLKIRNRIVRVIEKSLPSDEAGLLNGMLIGYTEGLHKDLQTAFSDAGLSHIMAVSGMNIGFIVLPLVFLFKKLRIRQFIANGMIMIILIMFIFVTGFSPSVVRAVIMAIVILAGQLLRRDGDAITSLAFAALLLLLVNPLLLFDIGFQLSFAATFSLILFYRRVKSLLTFRYVPRFLTDIIAVTVSAQLGVLPITAFYFNKISLISLVTNLIIVPLTGIITVLGFVMALMGQIHLLLSQWVGYINYSFLSFILFITKISADLPFATVKIITPGIGLIILYYTGILYFLWYQPKTGIKIKKQWLAVGISVILLIFSLTLFYPRDLEVVFIDVGQGDSALIKTAGGTTVLIDGGGKANNPSSEVNIGEKTVIPFLLDYGVSKLDLVIGTHGHEDHIQGLSPVLKEFPVDNFVIPDLKETKEFESLLQIAEQKKIKVTRCQKGEKIRLDSHTYFDVLHPRMKEEIAKSSLNNSSLVLKLNYKEISMLFVGDIENEVEKNMVAGKDDLKVQVLKVGHHGSASSTSLDFIRRLEPVIAVISVGKNSFGHPAPQVLERLEELNVNVYRTDYCGAVIIRSDGRKIQLRKMIQ